MYVSSNNKWSTIMLLIIYLQRIHFLVKIQSFSAVEIRNSISVFNFFVHRLVLCPTMTDCFCSVELAIKVNNINKQCHIVITELQSMVFIILLTYMLDNENANGEYYIAARIN
jgi:hypothetical protein